MFDPMSYQVTNHAPHQHPVNPLGYPLNTGFYYPIQEFCYCQPIQLEQSTSVP